jgi:hypothetical protein
MNNKSLILGIGLIVVAIYIYRKNNVVVVAPTGMSAICGACSSADGKNC